MDDRLRCVRMYTENVRLFKSLYMPKTMTAFISDIAFSDGLNDT